MSTTIYDTGPLAVAVCAQTCDRCGNRGECVELGMASTGHDFTVYHLCTLQCWPNLVDAISERRELQT